MSLIPFSLALGVLSNDPNEQATNYKTSTPVTIKQNVDGNPLASIYLDEDGTTPLSNPMNTDTRGVAAFYIEAGEYIAEYQDDLQLVTSKFSVSTSDHSKLANRNAVGAHDAIYARQFDSVDDMLSYDGLVVGERYSTGSTTWMYNGFVDGSISDFTPIGLVNISDFGAIGDGATVNTTAFQDALDTGFSVTIPNGDFVCGQVTMSDNQSIIGVGRTSRLITTSASSAILHGNGCEIKNFTITPISTDTTFTHPNDGFDDPNRTFQYKNGAIGIGSKSSGLSGVKITGMYIEKLWRGISLSDCDNATVTGNTIKWIGVWQTQFYNVRRLTFSNNICIYGGSSGGVAASSVKYATFTGNIVIGSGTGINTGGSTDPLFNAEKVVITGNVVLARDCINLENGIKYATVSGNHCEVFRNNDLPGITGVGISCSSDSSSGGAAGLISYCTITGNTINPYNTTVAYGIRVSTEAANYPHGFVSVIVSNNNIGSAQDGVRVASGTDGVIVKDVSITGNVINAATKGIRVIRSESVSIDGNNIIQGSTQPLSGYDAVSVNKSSNVTVTRNKFVGYSVDIFADIDSTLVRCYNNEQLPHRISGTRGTGNSFADTTNYSFWNGDGMTTVTSTNNRLYVCSPFIRYQPAATHTVSGLIGGVGFIGQTVSVKFNGNTTLQGGSGIELNSATFIPPANGVVTFKIIARDKIAEVSRSF